jgi:bifunctional non-homologous end joining protein LigD
VFAWSGGHYREGQDSTYRSGRSGDWLKIKCHNSESFAVIGYEPSVKVCGSIASLLLAARKGDGFVYVGNVGTGFSTKLARDLKQQLDGIRVDKPAAPVKGKTLVFTEPRLIAEVVFSGWTGDGKLRHASFKGIREVADNADIYDPAKEDRHD